MTAIQRLNPTALNRLLFSIESVRGTAEASPTKFMKMEGMLTPKDTKHRGNDGLGIMANNTLIARTRQWAELSGKAMLNVPRTGDLLRLLAKGGAPTPVIPASTTLTEQLNFTPNMFADDLDTITVWDGNPGVQEFQSAGVALDEFAITSDGSGSNGVEASLKGTGLFPTKVSAPTLPALTIDTELIPANAQLFIDSATGTIGTTAVAGRIVKLSPKITTGRVYAYDDVGPGNVPTITGYGVDVTKRVFSLGLTLELTDVAQYDLWAAMAILKLRLRLNGALIETIGGTTKYFEYVNFDVTGPFDTQAWGDANKSKTIDLTLLSHYDTGLATDWSASVQRKIGS